MTELEVQTFRKVQKELERKRIIQSIELGLEGKKKFEGLLISNRAQLKEIEADLSRLVIELQALESPN